MMPDSDAGRRMVAFTVDMWPIINTVQVLGKEIKVRAQIEVIIASHQFDIVPR